MIEIPRSEGHSSPVWMIRRNRHFGEGLINVPPYVNPGNVFIVDYNDGNDNNSGIYATDPLKTITASISKCENDNNDVVLVLDGDYDNEIVDLNKSGIHVIGNGLNQTEGMRFIFTTNHVELAGFMIDYSLGNAHGIQIQNANNFWIHHNTIKNITGAFDGIDKSAGSTVINGRIEKNTIYSCGGSGIGMVNFDRCRIIRNWIYANTGQGIILNAACDRNLIAKNNIFDNIEGIEIQGNNNYISGNAVSENTNGDLVNAGTNNRWIGNKFNNISSGTHTTSGVLEETVFTQTCVQPLSRVLGYLRLNNLIVGDDFDFRVKKSNDGGANWDITDETNIAGAPTVLRYEFDEILEYSDEILRVTVQLNGANDRAFYHKRTLSNS